MQAPQNCTVVTEQGEVILDGEEKSEEKSSKEEKEITFAKPKFLNALNFAKR